MKKIIFLFYLLIPLFVQAETTINLEPAEHRVAPGSVISVNVSIIAQNSVNAFEGTITVPVGLKVDHIEHGSSIVTAWIKAPTAEDAKVDFAGITPGGYSGEGDLFTLFLVPENEGIFQLGLNAIKILKHDGEGTEDDVVKKKILIFSSNEYQQIKLIKQDTIPPELFDVLTVRNHLLLNNKWYVQWQAQDKESGIKNHEVLETRHVQYTKDGIVPKGGTWITTTPPYILKDQTRRSYVFVRVTDQYGNEKVSMIYPLFNNNVYIIIGIFIVFIVIAAYTHIYKRKKNG